MEPTPCDNSSSYCGHNASQIWIVAIADLCTSASYFSIPAVLACLVVRQDIRVSFFNDSRLKFHARMTVLLFILFVALCGLTHFMACLSLVANTVRAGVVFKAMTGAVSVVTALYLVHVLPLFLAFFKQLELTKRGLPEEILRRHENIYNSSVQLITTHCYTVDTCRIRSVNPACREFGYSRSELRGVSLYDLVVPADHAVVAQALAAVQARPLETVTVEYRLQSRDGCTCPVESTISTCVEESIVFMLMTRDISSRLERDLAERERERLLAESQTRQNYISSIAHDLKTPLATFQLSIDLLARGSGLSRDHRQILEDASVAIELMHLTVHQAIDFARICDSKGALQPRRTVVSLPQLIRKCNTVLDGYTKEVPLHFHLDESVASHVLSDGDWLWQMAVNLLTNACKHTAFGYINLNITIEEQPPPVAVVVGDVTAGSDAAATAAAPVVTGGDDGQEAPPALHPGAKETTFRTNPPGSARFGSSHSIGDGGGGGHGGGGDHDGNGHAGLAASYTATHASSADSAAGVLAGRFKRHTVVPAFVDVEAQLPHRSSGDGTLAPAPATAGMAATPSVKMFPPPPSSGRSSAPGPPLAALKAAALVEGSGQAMMGSAQGMSLARSSSGSGTSLFTDGQGRAVEAPRWQGPFLRFAVSDTGIGIPDDRKAELFKPFSQLQARQSQGTGLGLYSVHRKAARLGGYCGCMDNQDPLYGQGTVFFFCVPYIPEDESFQEDSFTDPKQELERQRATARTSHNLDQYMRHHRPRHDGSNPFFVINSGHNWTGNGSSASSSSAVSRGVSEERERRGTDPHPDLQHSAHSVISTAAGGAGSGGGGGGDGAGSNSADGGAGPMSFGGGGGPVSSGGNEAFARHKDAGNTIVCALNPLGSGTASEGNWPRADERATGSAPKAMLETPSPQHFAALLNSAITTAAPSNSSLSSMAGPASGSPATARSAAACFSAAGEGGGCGGGDFGGRSMVLIIDDTLTVRRLMSRAVDKMGLRAAQAQNGAVGLQQLQTGRFLLTFCDLQMPIMDGFECIRRFREWEAKTRPGQRREAVLAMSANHDDLDLCRAAGFDGFCPKPVKLQVLQRIIGHWKDLADADWPRIFGGPPSRLPPPGVLVPTLPPGALSKAPPPGGIDAAAAAAAAARAAACPDTFRRQSDSTEAELYTCRQLRQVSLMEEWSRGRDRSLSTPSEDRSVRLPSQFVVYQ